MEDSPVTGQQGSFLTHREDHIGNSAAVQFGQGLEGFLPAEDTMAGKLGNLILVGFDKGRFFLCGGNKTASAGIHQDGNPGGPAAADQFTVEILRHASGYAAADCDDIRFRKRGGEIM